MLHAALLGIPALERPHRHRSEDTQIVVAAARRELLVGRIPHCFAQFQPRTLLAVGVDALFLVEIDAVGGIFGFKGRAVVVELMVHVVLVRGKLRLLRKRLVGILPPHLRVDQRLVIVQDRLSRILDPSLHRLVTIEPDRKNQFVETAVAVQVVQLRGHLHDFGRRIDVLALVGRLGHVDRRPLDIGRNIAHHGPRRAAAVGGRKAVMHAYGLGFRSTEHGARRQQQKKRFHTIVDC